MPLENAIKTLVSEGFSGTQSDMLKELEASGLTVNQSSVSRALRRLGAHKSAGKWVLEQPRLYATLGEHVTSMQHNEQLIVIRTIPGSAHFVASFIDQKEASEVLGTIAGDDTVVVIPSQLAHLEKTYAYLSKLIN